MVVWTGVHRPLYFLAINCGAFPGPGFQRSWFSWKSWSFSACFFCAQTYGKSSQSDESDDVDVEQYENGRFEITTFLWTNLIFHQNEWLTSSKAGFRCRGIYKNPAKKTNLNDVNDITTSFGSIFSFYCLGCTPKQQAPRISSHERIARSFSAARRTTAGGSRRAISCWIIGLLMCDFKLVGGDWNLFFSFPFLLGMSLSQLTNSYFSEELKPPIRYIDYP